MITTLLDIVRNTYIDSLVVTRVEWAEDNLRLWLHLTDDEDFNVHPNWQVICSGVREDFLLMGYCDDVELTDSHVLLLPHKQLQTSTSFYGTAENPLAVVGALYDKHREIIGDWIPFHRFLNPLISLKALIVGGYGMLAEGPEQLILAYEEVMQSYGFSTSHLDPRPPGYWRETESGYEWIKNESNLQVLVMGQSYVIAEQFTAEAVVQTQHLVVSKQRLKKATMDNIISVEAVIRQAQPVLDRFYDAVVGCGCKPPFKPTIRVADTPGSMFYDPENRAVVLVPYEVLPPARRAAMARFAAIGTLGLSGREQYTEVFNNLLVAHELGHWLQELAQRPLTRWQAEYEANRIMVAFWRDYPNLFHAASTEKRLANFVAQAPNTLSPMPDNTDMSVEEYFNTHLAESESNPLAYAYFQKMMVRQAIAERPVPTFCALVVEAWTK